MNEIRDEKELLRQLAGLPRAIAPARDVWPQISARISEVSNSGTVKPARFRTWQLATAAALLMTIAAGLILDRGWDGVEPAPTAKNSAMSPPVAREEPFYPGSTVAAELEYQAALREFMALNEASTGTDEFQPDWIEQGWGTLRQVELELSNALRQQPDNEFLNSRMAALRARQIELLRQIAATDEASWRNNI